MRNHASSAFALVALLAGIGCSNVVTEGEGALDLTPMAVSFEGGGDSYLFGTSLASGPGGDILIGGTFTEDVDFGGGFLSADAGSAVFLAHLDQDGNHLFSGSTGYNDGLNAAAIGPEGQLYLAGTYDGAINFGSGKLTGYKNGYFAAFDAEGGSEFSFPLGGEAEDWADDMTVSPAGDIIVAVRAGNDSDFGGGPASPTFTQKDAVVVSYSADGELRWEVRIPKAIYANLSVAADAAGNVVVSGMSYDDIEIGQLKSGPGAFIAKIGANGTPLWLDTSSQDYSPPYFGDMVVDADGSVLVAGFYYYGTFEIGGLKPEVTEQNEAFWLRLSAAGQGVSVHNLHADSNYGAPQLAVAPDGDVLLAMTTWYAVDFGGGQLSNGPEQNAVLARFTADGQHVASTELSGTLNEYVSDLAADPEGNPVLLGWFDDSMSVAGKDLKVSSANVNAKAMYVARLKL